MTAILCRLFLSLRRTHAKVAENQQRLQIVNKDLSEALSQVKRLTGLIPMCARCKSVRDDAGYWKEIEAYIGEHSEALCSHGICPPCATELYPELKIPDTPPVPDA